MTPARQWSARVLAKRVVADKVALTLSNSGPPMSPRAGQYLALGDSGAGSSSLGPILRRMAWIASRADRGLASGGAGSAIEVVANRGDAGGRWLADRQRGDTVDALGPLGRPFSLPREPLSCLLVAVGPGAASAALLALARELTARDCRVEFVLASETTAPFGLLEARRISTATHVLGPGTATAGEVLEIARVAEPDVLYLAGQPEPLLPVIDRIDGVGLQRQVALEVPAVCGSGVCAGCAIPVRGNDRVTRMVRVCTEGPVFNADLVRWRDLNTVPEDCAGALGSFGVGS